MGKWIAFGIGIILLLSLGLVIYFLATEFLQLYKKADTNVRLSLITAIGSVIAFVTNNALQSSRERKARLYDKKREAYEDFFAFFFQIFENVRNEKEIPQDEMIRRFQFFTKGVMTWGSAATVNALNNFQRKNMALEYLDSSSNEGLKFTFENTETLLRALRKDLGHSDGSLEKFALTKLIVKADEHHKFD